MIKHNQKIGRLDDVTIAQFGNGTLSYCHAIPTQIDGDRYYEEFHFINQEDNPKELGFIDEAIEGEFADIHDLKIIFRFSSKDDIKRLIEHLNLAYENFGDNEFQAKLMKVALIKQFNKLSK